MAKSKPVKHAPIPSEPTLKNPGQFAELSRCFEINQIALTRTSAQHSLGDDVGELNVSIRFAVKAVARVNGDAIRITVGLRLRGAQESDDETKLQIEAEFRLTYRVLHGSNLSEDDLAMFADLNARFNVWPYWREYVQNTMARMMLAPLTLPLMKVRPASK